MDSLTDYAIAKAIVQSGQTDDEWDTLRQGKGSWPEDERKGWKQYRKYSLDKLIEMMDAYKQNTGAGAGGGGLGASTVVVPSVFLFKGTIINSKRRASCRYTVYELAEAHRGKVRVGEADDGINYDPNASDNLCVQLVFEEKRSAEDFESQFNRLPGRWRKRPSLSMAVPDMSIESDGVSTVPFTGALKRVMSSNYRKVEKAGDTEVSPDFDQYSWTSIVTGVEIDDEVRLRLLEREDSKALFRQKAEKCHIIGRKNKTYEYDPNNIVFCSRNLHQQYDAIASTVGVEQFYLRYVTHDPNPCAGLVNRKQRPVYTTTVHVIFIDEQAKNTLHSDFKLHSDVDGTTIQLELHFQDPLVFGYCAKERAKLTCARWKSYEGIND